MSKSEINKQVYLRRGIDYLQAKKYALAKENFENLIILEKNNSTALHLLGITEHLMGNNQIALTYLYKSYEYNKQEQQILIDIGLVQTELGNINEAQESFKKAIEIDPKAIVAHFNYANNLAKQNKYAEAKKIYENIINKDIRNYWAYINLGNCYAELNEFHEAEKNYKKGIQINSNIPDGYYNLGNLLNKHKKYKEAIKYFCKCIELNNNHIEAHCNLVFAYNELKEYKKSIETSNKALKINETYAPLLNNYGLALHHLGEFDLAIKKFDCALLIDSKFYEAYNNRGLSNYAKKTYLDSIKDFTQAIEMKSSFAEAYLNRSVVYFEINQLEIALNDVEESIKYNPASSDAYITKASILKASNKVEKALQSIDQAIELSDDKALAKWNKSLILLAEGKFKEGWLLFEERLRKESAVIKTNIPYWKNKENIRKILICGEQGIGDQILFSTFLNKVKNLYLDVTVGYDKKIVPLMQRSFNDIKIIDRNDEYLNSDMDAYIPICSLAYLLKSDMKDHSANFQQYIKIDYKSKLELEKKVKNDNKLICGITWKSYNQNIGISKSLKLKDLLPIIEIDDLKIISLQYGEVEKEIDEININRQKKVNIIENIDNTNNLDEHAALIDICDILVMVSNTSAHIAGALGKKVFLIKPRTKGSLWYWENKINNHSMWYPSIKIFDELDFGDIENIVNQIKIEIVKNLS